MKTILVDAIHAFVLENKKINKSMYDLLETFPNKKILLTNASGDRFNDFGLNKISYIVFTLKGTPKKSNPQYYKKMLSHFDLKSSEVVYFEHNRDAVKSARSIGINTFYYNPKKKNLIALKNFLSNNL